MSVACDVASQMFPFYTSQLRILYSMSGTLGISHHRQVRCTVRDVRGNLGLISLSEVASLHSMVGTLHCAVSEGLFLPLAGVLPLVY